MRGKNFNFVNDTLTTLQEQPALKYQITLTTSFSQHTFKARFFSTSFFLLVHFFIFEKTVKMLPF